MALPMPVNTTCDIYRAGNAPPAAPDVQAACHLRPAYQEGLERGDSEAAKFRYTHVLSVDLAVDMRDDFDEFTGNAAGRDTLYIPDRTGIAFHVNFVERINRGWATDHKRVYLNRKLPTWPIPANVIVGGNSTIPGSSGVQCGGRASFAAWPLLISATGGVQVGGQPSIYHAFFHTPGAGISFGGQATAEFTPGESEAEPGATCAEAGSMTLGTTHGGTVPLTSDFHWWKFTVPSTQNYHITFTNTTQRPQYQPHRNGSCPTPTEEGANIPTSSNSQSICTTYSTWTSGDVIYLKINDSYANNNSVYTIKIESGSCP